MPATRAEVGCEIFPQACAWGYLLVPATRAFGASVRLSSEPIPGLRIETWGTQTYLNKLLDFRFQISDYIKEALIEAAVVCDGFFDGDVGDFEATENGDAAPLFLMHHVDSMEAIALAE